MNIYKYTYFIPPQDLDLLNVLRPPFYTLTTHYWLNWVNEDDDEDEFGLKEKPEDTRYIKKITSK